MKFIVNIEKEKYEEFVKSNPKSHFLQSYAWGEFALTSKGLKPHYVGVINDDGKIIATALLLEKKLPLGYSYFYSPRGYVIDYYDVTTLTFFTDEIKKYTKKYKSIFTKIDPDIIWSIKDNNNNEKGLPYDTKRIFNNIKNLGFKHKGFTKNFETMQPRYTFRIDMGNQSIDEIESKFSKTTKQRIKKANSLDVKVRIGDINDVEKFNELMIITENRKNFLSYDLNYYKNLYKIYNKDNKFLLFMGSVNPKEILEKYKNSVEKLSSELNSLPEQGLSKTQSTRKKELLREKENAEKAILEYDQYKDKDEIVLNAHAIIIYNDKAWVLYAGNHNILTNTFSNYKTYFEHIKYCYDNGIKTYDQFGTIGNLSKNNPRLGLHEFKKKFGGDYVEFIGEFDLITKPLMYFVFTTLVPLFRKFKREKAKKGLKNEIR